MAKRSERMKARRERKATGLDKKTKRDEERRALAALNKMEKVVSKFTVPGVIMTIDGVDYRGFDSIGFQASTPKKFHVIVDTN